MRRVAARLPLDRDADLPGLPHRRAEASRARRGGRSRATRTAGRARATCSRTASSRPTRRWSNGIEWERYGPGNDQRCEHCGIHSGFEPAADDRDVEQPEGDRPEPRMDVALSTAEASAAHVRLRARRRGARGAARQGAGRAGRSAAPRCRSPRGGSSRSGSPVRSCRASRRRRCSTRRRVVDAAGTDALGGTSRSVVPRRADRGRVRPRRRSSTTRPSRRELARDDRRRRGRHGERRRSPRAGGSPASSAPSPTTPRRADRRASTRRSPSRTGARDVARRCPCAGSPSRRATVRTALDARRAVASLRAAARALAPEAAA